MWQTAFARGEPGGVEVSTRRAGSLIPRRAGSLAVRRAAPRCVALDANGRSLHASSAKRHSPLSARKDGSSSSRAISTPRSARRGAASALAVAPSLRPVAVALLGRVRLGLARVDEALVCTGEAMTAPTLTRSTTAPRAFQASAEAIKVALTSVSAINGA